MEQNNFTKLVEKVGRWSNFPSEIFDIILKYRQNKKNYKLISWLQAQKTSHNTGKKPNTN